MIYQIHKVHGCNFLNSFIFLSIANNNNLTATLWQKTVKLNKLLTDDDDDDDYNGIVQ